MVGARTSMCLGLLLAACVARGPGEPGADDGEIASEAPPGERPSWLSPDECVMDLTRTAARSEIYVAERGK